MAVMGPRRNSRSPTAAALMPAADRAAGHQRPSSSGVVGSLRASETSDAEPIYAPETVPYAFRQLARRPVTRPVPTAHQRGQQRGVTAGTITLTPLPPRSPRRPTAAIVAPRCRRSAHVRNSTECPTRSISSRRSRRPGRRTPTPASPDRASIRLYDCAATAVTKTQLISSARQKKHRRPAVLRPLASRSRRFKSRGTRWWRTPMPSRRDK